MPKSSIVIFLYLFILVNLGWPLTAGATIFFDSTGLSFDPEYIISDKELTDHKSMDLTEIQNFLEAVGGALAQKKIQDIDGRIKPASEIIYRTAGEHKINPRFLIVLLQREKSLITNPRPTTDDYNWATGFSCYDYGRPVQRFKGFARQVDRAAWRFRYYLEHPWQFRFEVGQKTKTLVNWKDRTFASGYSEFVTPKNQATAGLYNYAPHVYDNQLFWKIWNWKIWEKWFGKKDEKFPDGSLVRAREEKGVWLIQDGKRRPFCSKSVFLVSYNFKNVQEVSYADLEAYEIGPPMTFPNYSLVRVYPHTKNLVVGASLGEIFMLVGDKKRSISEKIFRAIGFHPEEIIDVQKIDLEPYKDDRPILSPYPTGALLQDNLSKGVYYVKENAKYPIIDIEILMANFPYNHIIKVGPEELSEFKTGETVKFKDGVLIKTAANPTVYVVSQGKRLPIFSSEIFGALGYQWDTIIIVSEPVLNLHPLGEIIKIE